MPDNPYLKLIDEDAPVRRGEEEVRQENPYTSLITKEEPTQGGSVTLGQPNIIDPTRPTVAGAVAGAVVGPTAQRVLASTLTPTSSAPAKTAYNPRGVNVQDSVANWRNYQEAQSEVAKGVRRNTDLQKKFPNFTRAMPEQPPQNIMQRMLSPLEAMGQKLGGIGNVIGQTAGPRIGGALGLGGGALQGTEAYNRQQQGDIPGALIAGAGSLGSAASMLPPVSPPTAIAKGVGATAAFASPFALMLYDYLRKQNPTIGQPNNQTPNVSQPTNQTDNSMAESYQYP
jgi:hypothetical protein